MASHEYRGMLASEGPSIKSFGTFSVTDHSGQRKLTLSKNLKPEPFPIAAGTEIKVEQVDPDDGSAYLRLIPIQQ